MLYKTQGIVISYIPYRETSVIVKIYTERFGVQSYIENGVRSSKSKNKIALFQPLTFLDLVVYHKHSNQQRIQRIAEMKCVEPFRSLPFELGKSAIGMFITEILSRVLHEEEENPSLFEFLREAIFWLDDAPQQYEHFHLIFLLRLSAYLGFAPLDAQEIADQLREGGYKQSLSLEEMRTLDTCIERDFDNHFKSERRIRNLLLEHLLAFYRLHIETLGEIKSLAVLREVMR